MADNKHIDEPTGTETVGHEWDGIEELNTPLPRWWLWTFYATIIWGAAWVILYPAWPLIDRATEGVLGWTSRGQYEQEQSAHSEAMAPIRTAIDRASLSEIETNPTLRQQAVEGGRAAFRIHCVQCHGSGAAGSPGYPNLNDDDWLWGGSIDQIHFTLVHGIRNPDHAQTRASQMPAFGPILEPRQIGDLTAHVRMLSRQQTADAASQRGATLFAANCAACHSPDGRGNRELGAPNLTDQIWLYGRDADTIRETIANSRSGVMPRWGNRLDDVTIKMLAAYVHSLGGGEASRGATAATGR